MLRDAETTKTGGHRPRRKSHLVWLTAGALGLAIVGAGAVQAQRYHDDEQGYGYSHDGDRDRYDDRGDMRRNARSGTSAATDAGIGASAATGETGPSGASASGTGIGSATGT